MADGHEQRDEPDISLSTLDDSAVNLELAAALADAELDHDLGADQDRELTMAELKARVDRERELATLTGQPPAHESLAKARPRARDDELLTELPPSDHHLGRFAGWRAVRKVRWVVGISLSVALLAGVLVFLQNTRELRHRRLHPLPEVEATIAPGTSREMSISDGHMRVGLSREPPAVNLLHLPDRDITLARGADKAQFKVEVRDGKTVSIKVLTGEIVETLTDPTAEPLLD